MFQGIRRRVPRMVIYMTKDARMDKTTAMRRTADLLPKKSMAAHRQTAGRRAIPTGTATRTAACTTLSVL